MMKNCGRYVQVTPSYRLPASLQTERMFSNDYDDNRGEIRGREGAVDETVLNVVPQPFSHYAAVNSHSLHDKALLGNFLP